MKGSKLSNPQSRDEGKFSAKTKRKLFDKAGGLCSHPDCLIATSDGNFTTGQACHIYSAGMNGPRGRGSKDPVELMDEKNGIWLCSNDHLLIDPKKKGVEPISSETLFKWKSVREFAHSLTIHNKDISYLSKLVPVQIYNNLILRQVEEQGHVFGWRIERDLDVDSLTKKLRETAEHTRGLPGFSRNRVVSLFPPGDHASTHQMPLAPIPLESNIFDSFATDFYRRLTEKWFADLGAESSHENPLAIRANVDFAFTWMKPGTKVPEIFLRSRSHMYICPHALDTSGVLLSATSAIVPFGHWRFKVFVEDSKVSVISEYLPDFSFKLVKWYAYQDCSKEIDQWISVLKELQGGGRIGLLIGDQAYTGDHSPASYEFLEHMALPINISALTPQVIADALGWMQKLRISLSRTKECSGLTERGLSYVDKDLVRNPQITESSLVKAFDDLLVQLKENNSHAIKYEVDILNSDHDQKVGTLVCDSSLVFVKSYAPKPVRAPL